MSNKDNIDYLQYSTLPLTTQEAEIANALDVLRAYPGKDAGINKLKVWEAMRDSVLYEEEENAAH